MDARFEETTASAFKHAQMEARDLGHRFIGTEQVLLGLLRHGENPAAKILEAKGVCLAEARVEVEKLIGRGPGSEVEELPLTPRTQRLLELAADESKELGKQSIACEHLLLAIIREGGGDAFTVLGEMGIDFAQLRQDIIANAN